MHYMALLAAVNSTCKCKRHCEEIVSQKHCAKEDKIEKSSKKTQFYIAEQTNKNTLNYPTNPEVQTIKASYKIFRIFEILSQFVQRSKLLKASVKFWKKMKLNLLSELFCQKSKLKSKPNTFWIIFFHMST